MTKKKRVPKYVEEEDSFIQLKDVTLTSKQKELTELIYNNKIIIATGPPGTSKTFCAAYAGLKLFSKGSEYNRIVLVKPTETVGNSLGYTPGSLDEKIGVFTENFYDVFEDIVDLKIIDQMIQAKELQFKIAQYVRGRTINKSVVIIDEFQNLDVHQLRSLVTRLGKISCKMIFCGDIKQSDISSKYVAVNVLKEVIDGLPETSVFEFTHEDVQFRDPLVTLIEKRFDKIESEGRLTPTKKN